MSFAGLPARAVVVAGLLVMSQAHADEGMWTLNDFPSDKVAKAYGFKPDQAWLDHVRLSSVRLAQGCSGSFVSKDGLIQTNHHCARECIEQLSSAEKNFTETGFYAKTLAEEPKCPEMEVNQLVAISDVTGRVHKATAGKEGAALADALKAEKAGIAQECSGSDQAIRCDVVELYHGGVFNLYKYRRFQDVRLVFAPETEIAFFGGDPDNFEFPRYDLDVSYVRVYDQDRPLDTSATHFPYASADAKEGDLTFVSGHPGTTARLYTLAQLEFLRDVVLPDTLFLRSELRGTLIEFSTKGPEQERIATDMLFGTENGLKALKGQLAALVDPKIIAEKTKAENALRRAVNADPKLKAAYAGAWGGIRTALDGFRDRRTRFVMTEGGQGFRSTLFRTALELVRHADESGKPDQTRLKEYTDANFPALRQSITSTAPVYPELEKLTLAFSLRKLREALGPDDLFVRKVLAGKSPVERAAELIDNSHLADIELRRRLVDSDATALTDANDSMIAFARLIDEDFRTERANYEATVEAPLTKFSGQIAEASFKILGRATYPDATFTLRLSYGAVKGFRQRGQDIPPFTTLGGAFDRATGSDPFRLPASWISAKDSLNLAQPFDFVATNDIIGGNSGSPMINKAGEIIGLIFDGNSQSLGGEFGYDGSVNRAVAVSVGALKESLAKTYHADRLVTELAQ
ncbi:S46 family peptidase [Telmatospirillum sp.]|uniref:S46 family peptidase n=1 Tax=Telmatospirillum sp. TaxID=2079197 RepID=UPI00284C9B3F|nr:S46 family peptidase [Telmatospirillum sp.]MDR3435962.1 S46 family peptidase [Telmatospirillum sp.]